MPKTRHDVAASVAELFIPTKQALTQAAAASYQTLATMLEQRDRAAMGPGFGAEALELTRAAADAAFTAVSRMHEAHAHLAVIRAEWAIPPGAYGPDDTVKLEDRSASILAFDRDAA